MAQIAELHGGSAPWPGFGIKSEDGAYKLKVGGQLQNVDIFTYPMVKDPWKIDNPPKS